MAKYSELSKLGRIKLPGSENSYALVDWDGRSLVASDYLIGSSYEVNDFVIYNDDLYRITKAINSTDNNEWTDVTKIATQISTELKAIKNNMTTGIHYIGYTTSEMSDGITTNPIIIEGANKTAIAGDIVIYKQLNKDGNITGKEFEYIFNGSQWNEFGSSGTLKNLAFKDEASGEYEAPTGTGTTSVTALTGLNKIKLGLSQGKVAVNTYTLEKTNIVPMGEGTEITYGSANVGTAVNYGTADVGTSVTVGTALTGTKTFNTDAISNASLAGDTASPFKFNTDAIKSATLSEDTTSGFQFNTNAISDAKLGGTTTFNTDAIKSASCNQSFTTEALKVSVDNDLLKFESVTPTAVNINTTAASTGSISISTTEATKKGIKILTEEASATGIKVSTTAAATGTVGLETTDITPAKAADTSRLINPATTSTSKVTVYAPATALDVGTSITTTANDINVTGLSIESGVTDGIEVVTSGVSSTQSLDVTVNTTTKSVKVS